MKFGFALSILPSLFLFAFASDARRVDIGHAIEVVRAAGPDAKGSREAAQAWGQLTAANVDQLPALLGGMDGASALARNWLRSAIDEVLARARREAKAIPLSELEVFLRERHHDPQARRLAFELISDVNKAAAERFLPEMIDDPSPDMRYDAVARLLDQADKADASGKKEDARKVYKQALDAARDKDQIAKSARRLRDLGQSVDLATHLGMITAWKVVGPFPNPKQGIDKPYPPEARADLSASYDGLKGKVGWKPVTTKHDYGVVDLNAETGSPTAAIAYAQSEFISPADRDVDVRIGCMTPFKLWLNGALALQRGDAYTGMSLDHYVAKVHLTSGKNVVLLKVVKDEPEPGAPKDWKFQLRVCAAGGVAILSADRHTPPGLSKQEAKGAKNKAG